MAHYLPLKLIHLLAYNHCNASGQLTLGEMHRLKCQSIFQTYEPLEEYRKDCPRILVVCFGIHSHPIPLPTKTPPSIRTEIFELLKSLDLDLPDLTPRRLLRHSVTQTFLQRRLPYLSSPTFANLHIFLTNREHLKAYIIQVQEQTFPQGTGWEGKPLHNICSMNSADKLYRASTFKRDAG